MRAGLLRLEWSLIPNFYPLHSVTLLTSAPHADRRKGAENTVGFSKTMDKAEVQNENKCRRSVGAKEVNDSQKP